VAESLEVAGFAIRSQIIWAKERLVLSRGDYHWQHEPALYCVRKTGKAHWAGDRKQTTLWQISSRDQDADTVHGTQKPGIIGNGGAKVCHGSGVMVALRAE
jgi:hypothetical protein